MQVRFDAGIDMASQVLDRFLELAPQKKRNFIWDQTNVTRGERERKLLSFRRPVQASYRGIDFRFVAHVFVSPDQVTGRQQHRT